MQKFTKQTFGKINYFYYLSQPMPKQKVEKKDIIKASLRVFKKTGYHKASMADIGKECGLLKGSIYHYFSSKEVLMREVLQYLHDYYNREVFVIAYESDLTGKHKLERLSEISEHIFLQESGGCLMANIGLETVNVVPEFSQMIKKFFDDWINALAHIYEEIYSKTQARQIAEQGVAEIEGAVLLMQLFKDEQLLHRAHRNIIDNYTIGLNKEIK